MRRLWKRVVVIGFLSGSLLFAQSQINAMKVPGDVSNIGPNSKAWLSTDTVELELFPQTTIKAADIDANRLNAGNKAKKVSIKALYDGKNISFLIQWKDESKSVQEGLRSRAYGDGFALQFPLGFEDIKTLPYIGMGSKGRAVLVHLQKATGNTFEPNGEGDVYHQLSKNSHNKFHKEVKQYQKEVEDRAIRDYERAFIAEGFGSMTQIKDGSASGVMEMEYENGQWRGTLSRPLKSEYLNLMQGAFPVAFAIWDGDKKNRDGIKHLSGWIGVKLIGKSGGDDFLKQLSTKAKGDIANGEKVASENCATCHNFAKNTMAPPFMAPNLSNIGGYATSEYLLESIDAPSAVVVPGYNPNAHPNFSWYNLDEKGNRVSTMPAYDWLDAKSKSDLVAYLKTLKAEVE